MTIELPQPVIDGSAIAAFAGILLSIVFKYFPGLNTWFATKTSNYKRLTMFLAILIVTITLFILIFTGFWPILAPTKATAIWLFLFMVQALSSNQVINLVTPDTDAVAATKRRLKLSEIAKLNANVSEKG